MATLGLLVSNELKKSSLNVISLSRANYHTLKKYQKCYKLLGIHVDDKELQNTSRLATVGPNTAAVEEHEPDMTGALKLIIETQNPKREQREKNKNPVQLKKREFSKTRATQAAEYVVKHRISKISKTEDNFMFPNAKLFGLERTVEDMIQESISKGEFKNLPGFGKPLKNNDIGSPYVDFVTHRLNKVLIDNGCTPKWISYQKEIREDVQNLKDKLSKVRAKLGPHPLNKEESEKWEKAKLECQKLTKDINNKILNFNLLVPILEKQMLQFDLNRAANKILMKGAFSPRVVAVKSAKKQKKDVFGIFSVISKKFTLF